jgi:hypothetical protein
MERVGRNTRPIRRGRAPSNRCLSWSRLVGNGCAAFFSASLPQERRELRRPRER